MKIIRAQHLGMCFGVRDAIQAAFEANKNGPITILGDLVHNERVLGGLRRRGIAIERELKNVTTTKVMITAHGASDKSKRLAREAGFEVGEATCPLVHFVHATLKRLVAEKYFPIIIGVKGHTEVLGLTGDLADYAVILSDEEVASLPAKERFGVVAQTTQPIGRVQSLVETIRRSFPSAEVKFVDTVCQPTKQRQAAAARLASECDVVVVIGGKGSNNTRELVEKCSKTCSRVHLVQSPEDLVIDWFESSDTVGITAGTSTPDEVIDQVQQALEKISATLVPVRHAA